MLSALPSKNLCRFARRQAEMNLMRAKFTNLAVLSLVFFSLTLLLAFAVSLSGQTRRQPTQRKAAIDYSRFSHATEKHRRECNSCHKVPTSNWQRASGFPDIADYPGHEACVSCHRSQFFRGSKPIICTNCHTRVSPSADERLAFRKPNIPSQFTIEFPHDRHQDVIARLMRRLATPQFVRVAFQRPETKTYNNCAICHQPQTVFPTSGLVDEYVPDALTFKTAPTDHASCFNCHWAAQKPVRDNCAGCHKLQTTPTSLVSVPVRLSMKFKHDGGGAKKNHVAECTTCHINITKSATLRGLKPDVPITSCSECHNKDGLRLDVAGELAKIDKNHNFVCSYCHTSDVGRRDPPASHYVISGREPKTRKELE